MPDNVAVLYVAITRPAMKMGVPVEGLCANAAITYMAYLWIGHGNIYRMVATLLIFPILHIPMRILASIDHNYFRIGRLSLQRGFSFRNRAWNGEFLSAISHRAPATEREVAGSV